MNPRLCARCGKPITEPRRRTFCSEGCADVVAHQKRLERLGRGVLRPAKFRIYRDGEQVAPSVADMEKLKKLLRRP
jgi:hypothetical protein